MVKVTFLHPDLGIGGAERLVVDAALALKSRGYEVNFVTPHHDPSHSFKETFDGTLPVTVVGDWLPRSLLGRFFAVCAYLRMVYAAFYIILFSNTLPDVVFCDQVSACIPILQLRVKHVLFYCHFPDQLLSIPGNKLKTLYRIPLNWLEERTTGCADKILVNSKFTRQVFKDTFTTLTTIPEVLHPSINTQPFDNTQSVDLKDLGLSHTSAIILSVNRYERKKNIKLAISALHELKQTIKSDIWERISLVIAGGYDTRVNENVEYYDELKSYAKDLNIESNVYFLRSPSDQEKLTLLLSCKMLLYTPSNEHFGIVPLEAMYAKKPVIAVNNGGPVETIANNVTGFLCESTKEAFAKSINVLLSNETKLQLMGDEGRKRFEALFSFNAFTNQLTSVIESMINSKKTD